MNEWISVDDRLPAEMDTYRVYIQNETQAYQRDAVYSASHGGWLDHMDPLPDVTHWMPLPPAPVVGNKGSATS